ncbi:MAG: glycosyltransferase family 39 protein [Eubacteriales bacterium]|jgi:4-amino-4-deoxy-L-arabinose transferase-like glycosyltransferase|nr:glycosyltransferase family 39 protein [Eubacteriales bacterium]
MNEKRSISSFGGIYAGSIAIFSLLILFMAVGLYYRIVFAYNIHFENLHLGTQFGHDEYNYIQMAKNIVEKGVYGYMSDAPNAYVTPAFPLFLAAFFYIWGAGGQALLYAKLTQAVLSTISILLVFLIGRRLCASSVGLIAAFFTAFYPPLILYSRHLLTETLYIFFFLLYFLIQITAFGKKRMWRHFLAGFFMAAAILTRPMVFILAPLPYIYRYFSKRTLLGKTAKQFGVFLLGAAILMLPWLARNIITLGKFIILCTQSNPFYYGIIEDYTSLPPSDNETADGIRLILHLLKTQPVKTIKWYTIGKINAIFETQDYWLQNNYKYLSSARLLHHFIIVCGSLGVLMSVYIKELRLVSLFIVISVLVQLLFIPVPRYAIPLIPLFSICAGYVICFLFSRCREKDFKGKAL